jgi:hypothetical protein
MKEKITVTRWSCDSPGCPVIHDEETDELPDGFHGTVTEISDLGEYGGVEWYACRAAHTRGAAEGALAMSHELD